MAVEMRLFLVLLCFWCINASVWKDDFTQAIASNPNLDQANVVEMKWDGASSYSPSKDPETVDPVLQDITGMWSMDMVNTTASTVPDSSPFKVSASLMGSYATIPGKFGNAIRVLDGYGNYIQVSPSPITVQQATELGFSVSMWFMPKNQSGGNFRLMEKIYDSFDLDLERSTASNPIGHYVCTVRDSTDKANFYRAYGPDHNITFNNWNHVACAYDPSSLNLTLYINGTLAGFSNANLTAGIYFGTGSTLALGTRPTISPSPPSKASDCAFDEVIFYGKTLTAANAKSLFQRTESVVPYPGPSFRSKLLPFTQGTSYWGFVPAWGTTSGSAADMEVEISTNRGLQWCKVTNGQHFGDDQLCRLPAANIIYRATLKKNLAVDYIQFTYDDTEPTRQWKKFPVGINRGGTNYYASNKMFKDVQNTAAQLGGAYDQNKYPTNITTSTLCLMAFDSNSNYTVFAKGNGSLTFRLNAGNQKVRVPEDIPAKLVGTAWGVNVDYDVGPNHIYDMHVVPNQFVDDYQEKPFWPVYLERFQDFSIVRYMDAMATNGNNLAHWSDRALPTDWSQDTSNVIPPVKITSLTMPAGGSTDPFAGKWSCLVTTATPHSFVTGQVVTISGTNALVTDWTFDGTSMGNFSLNVAAHVSVVSSTTFWFIMEDVDWHLAHWYYDRTTLTFKAGNTGQFQNIY